MDQLNSEQRVRASRLFEVHSESVLQRLQRRNPLADLQDISDAVVDAVMEIAENGTKEDPAQGTIDRLLRRVANRRLIDRFRQHARRRGREKRKVTCDVTKRESVTNEPGQNLMDSELAVRYFDELARNDEDKYYLRRRMEGLSDEDIVNQYQKAGEDSQQVAKRIKRVGERIRQRMSRLRKRVAEEESHAS